LEEQTSTVDNVTKTEPTAKELNKCFSKNNITSDNSPLQKNIDHGTYLLTNYFLISEEPDTIKEKPIKEEHTSTVDIATQTELTENEPKKCSSKDNILSDNPLLQKCIDHGKKVKSSNTKISQSKNEDDVIVVSNVASSIISNNLKGDMNIKKNIEQSLINLWAAINNLESEYLLKY
jgi:hypothetical protein